MRRDAPTGAGAFLAYVLNPALLVVFVIFAMNDGVHDVRILGGLVCAVFVNAWVLVSWWMRWRPARRARREAEARRLR